MSVVLMVCLDCGGDGGFGFNDPHRGASSTCSKCGGSGATKPCSSVGCFRNTDSEHDDWPGDCSCQCHSDDPLVERAIGVGWESLIPLSNTETEK